jgi:hypothetical protein
MEMTEMSLKPGTRLWSAVSAVSLVVVRPPSQEVTLTCGGAPMLDHEAPVGGAEPVTGEGPVIGKRYVDEQTGLQVLCTRGAPGVLAVDGRPLEMMSARPLPASD